MLITETKRLLARVVINNYPSSILVAKKIAPKYFVLHTSKKRGKKIFNIDQLPKKYQTLDYGFNKEGYLINVHTKERQISNPIKTGQERYWVVNFQDIWNQNVVKQARAIRSERLKEIFKPHLQKINPFKLEDYPIELNITIFDKQFNVDASNKGVVYVKVIEDTMKELGIIPDDKAKFINCSGRIKLITIPEDQIPKMVISIFKSDNDFISNQK